MKALTPKRKKFCKLISAGESGAGAYRKAYKNKNSNTCKRNAHRLLQQPAVLVYLSFTPNPEQDEKLTKDIKPTVIQTVYGKEMEAREAQLAQEAEEAKKKGGAYQYSPDEEMSPTECKAILSRIGRGTVTSPKFFMYKGELIEAQVPPTFAQRRACIAELNKMRGIYKKPLLEDMGGARTITLIPV